MDMPPQEKMALEARVLFAAVNLATLIAYIAIWHMRLSGLILLTGLYIFSIIYNFAMGIGNYWGYIPGAIIIIICLLYAKKMK